MSCCSKFPGTFLCPSITKRGAKRGEIRMCYCVLWLNGHSSWMWWMLGGRRCRRGKRKAKLGEKKKGIEKEKKKVSSREKIFISIFHIHFRDISIMDIFLMPRTCYMLMLMLFHLIFPFPIPLSSIEMELLWIEQHWCERGESAQGTADIVERSSLYIYILFHFFDVSFVKKIVITISIMLFTPSTIQRKKKLYVRISRTYGSIYWKGNKFFAFKSFNTIKLSAQQTKIF